MVVSKVFFNPEHLGKWSTLRSNSFQMNGFFQPPYYSPIFWRHSHENNWISTSFMSPLLALLLNFPIHIFGDVNVRGRLGKDGMTPPYWKGDICSPEVYMMEEWIWNCSNYITINIYIHIDHELVELYNILPSPWCLFPIENYPDLENLSIFRKPMFCDVEFLRFGSNRRSHDPQEAGILAALTKR